MADFQAVIDFLGWILTRLYDTLSQNVIFLFVIFCILTKFIVDILFGSKAVEQRENYSKVKRGYKKK